jgi:copper chaperone CopZ
MAKANRSITVMHCANCAASLEKSLGDMAGIGKAVVRMRNKLQGAAS